MSDRYFLGLLVVLSAASAVWMSLVPYVAQTQLWVALMLVLLGLTALINLNNQKQASILMLLYFTAALSFSLYAHLNQAASMILVSVTLLSLVGAVLSLGITPGMPAAVTKSVAEVIKPAKKLEKEAPKKASKNSSAVKSTKKKSKTNSKKK